MCKSHHDAIDKVFIVWHCVQYIPRGEAEWRHDWWVRKCDWAACSAGSCGVTLAAVAILGSGERSAAPGPSPSRAIAMAKEIIISVNNKYWIACTVQLERKATEWRNITYSRSLRKQRTGNKRQFSPNCRQVNKLPEGKEEENNHCQIKQQERVREREREDGRSAGLLYRW